MSSVCQRPNGPAPTGRSVVLHQIRRCSRALVCVCVFECERARVFVSAQVDQVDGAAKLTVGVFVLAHLLFLLLLLIQSLIAIGCFNSSRVAFLARQSATSTI